MLSLFTLAILPFFCTQVLGFFPTPPENALIPRQSAPELPALSTCSQQCIAQSLPASGCSPSDAACICTSVALTNATTLCLTANCTIIDALEARRYSAISCHEPVRSKRSLTQHVTWAMFTLATIGIVARMLSRLPALNGSGNGRDDWATLSCWAILIPSDAILDVMAGLGLGQDIWMLPDPNYQITQILYYFYVSEYTYVIEVGFTKISILLLYLRMWPESRGVETAWFRNSCHYTMALIASFTAVCFVVLGLQCQPISFSWTRWNPVEPGACINLNAMIFATAGINIGLDVLVIALPLPKLWSLSIPMRKKLVICITFSIGLFVTVCSIIRLRTLAVWGNEANVTYLYNPIAIWSNVEINLGVVCACMPAVAGLIQRTYTQMTGHKFSSYGRSQQHSALEKGQRQDRNYELRLNSFSDGTVKFHGYQGPHGNIAKPPVIVRVEPDGRSSLNSERPSEVSEIPTRPTELQRSQTSKTDPDQATEQMISAGYSAFANLKR